MTRQSCWRQALALLLTLCFLAAQSVAVTSSPELPDPGRVMISAQDQKQLGLQAMAEVYQQMPVLPDSSPVTQYVQQLGRRLVTVVPAEHTWPYQFHVVQQKEINAFALPGGPIFINIGTITAADNEAQLAGVMAHEMSHVYMQHSAKQAEKQQLAQGLAGILGALIGNSGGLVGSLAQAGIQIGGGMVMLKYSRNDEAQADAVGAIIMYKAGYDPRALPAFFQKLEQQGGAPPQFLSDHPNPGNRVAAIDQEIANWPPKRYQGDAQAFARAHQQAQQVKAYTAQEIDAGAKQGQWAHQNQQGAAAAATSQPAPAAPPAPASQPAPASAPAAVAWPQVAPSSNFTTFSNDAFSIKYPDNWQAGSGNGGLTIAPAAGLAQGAISYGAMIGGFQPQSGGSDTLGDGTNQLIATLQQSNSSLQTTGSPQDVRVNQVAGKSVDMSSASPLTGPDGQSLPEHDWLVSLQRPDGTLLFVIFIAPEKDFARMQKDAFVPMLRSLRVK